MNKIIWLTGESRAGKSTLAEIARVNIDCIVLDGDEMRDSISLGAGFSKEERREHNLRVARLARTLSRQKNVIVSVIAPMENVRREIVEICNPTWVYIKRTLSAREGHFYEVPEKYHYIIDNDRNIEDSSKMILQIISEVFKK